MKTWGPPLLLTYALWLMLHGMFYYVLDREGVFWVGDVYWIGTGVALFGLAQSLEAQKKGRFIPVYFVGGLLRMLLGLGAVILPLSLRDAPNFQSAALQFVAAYLFMLVAESALAIFWIKKQ
ncbi:hypothetical protein N9N00_04630 [Schleiferiaceae bacterium]|jgi:hypothetical protein|nr:hypothetical protein [Schleiferiaceae bacterium]